jgi:hypothetical protein
MVPALRWSGDLHAALTRELRWGRRKVSREAVAENIGSELCAGYMAINDTVNLVFLFGEFGKGLGEPIV